MGSFGADALRGGVLSLTAVSGTVPCTAVSGTVPFTNGKNTVASSAKSSFRLARATIAIGQQQRSHASAKHHNTTKMRAFGTEISANRMPGGELSDLQRASCLSLAEAGVGTKKIAATLNCTRRAVRKTKQRWNNLQSCDSAPRSGRPYTLSDRDVRRL